MDNKSTSTVFWLFLTRITTFKFTTVSCSSQLRLVCFYWSGINLFCKQRGIRYLKLVIITVKLLDLFMIMIVLFLFCYAYLRVLVYVDDMCTVFTVRITGIARSVFCFCASHNSLQLFVCDYLSWYFFINILCIDKEIITVVLFASKSLFMDKVSCTVI